MADQFSEVTNVGWFSRIGESLKGVVFGLVLIVVAFVLLFWNEGRTVTMRKSLDEGAAAVVPVTPEKVDAANENKLVHMSGRATTDETLADADFGVDFQGLKLQRAVEIFQWKEEKKTETKKKIGGGEQQVTTYTYSKSWVNSPVDSSGFKERKGHENTGSLEFSSSTKVAGKITVGAFTLPSDLVDSIRNFEPLRVTQVNLDRARQQVKDGWKLNGEWVYKGAQPDSPAIGDQRLKFSAAKPADVSYLAQQAGNTFRPYPTKAGKPILRLQMGLHSPEAMFAQAKSENTVLAWLLRVGGFVLMALGISCVFKPLVVLADFIPLLGDLLGLGLGLFSMLIAAGLSLTTIAIGWIVYRPVLGVALLALAALLVAFLFMAGHQRRLQRQAG